MSTGLLVCPAGCVFCVPLGEQAGEGWGEGRGVWLFSLASRSLGPRQRQRRAWGSLVIGVLFGRERQARECSGQQQEAVWAGYCPPSRSPAAGDRDLAGLEVGSGHEWFSFPPLWLPLEKQGLGVTWEWRRGLWVACPSPWSRCEWRPGPTEQWDKASLNICSFGLVQKPFHSWLLGSWSHANKRREGKP